MLKAQSRISLIRKRSAADKVYVPENARENQYILIEFKPDLKLMAEVGNDNSGDTQVADFYRSLSHLFFELCEQHHFENVCFIAKDKLVRVMYAENQQVIETEEQILFMYNPKRHTGLRTFFEQHLLAEKIELLFLATGDELRQRAPNFHQRVCDLIVEFCQLTKLNSDQFKMLDHQHLTYDVFAAYKGEKKTITHGFRPITKRYLQNAMIVPANHNSMTFVVAKLPMNQELIRQCDIDESAPDPYNPLYTHISDLFVKTAKKFNLNQLAIIANNKIPIVRQDNEDYVLPQGELLHLGFKANGSGCGFVSQWDSKNLVDSVYLVFIASKHDVSKRGYGRFVNHCTDAIRSLSRQLAYQAEKDAIIVRFHQHLQYPFIK